MTKIDRIALAILVFGGAAVISGVGGIHFADPPATFTSLPRLAEVDAAAIRESAKLKLPVAADSSKPMPGARALVTALDDIKRTAANRPRTWWDEAALVHICRVRMMVDAGYTEAQIAVVPRGANGLLPPDEPCHRSVNDNVEDMTRSMAAADREIESKWHYTITTARAEASRATKDPVRGMIHVCRISELLNVQGPDFVLQHGRAFYTHEEVRALPRVNGLFEPSPLCSEQWVRQYTKDEPAFRQAMNGQVPANQRAIDRACRVALFLMMGGASREVADLMTMAGNTFCSSAEMLDTQRRVIARAHCSPKAPDHVAQALWGAWDTCQP
jgi:hypothetical protein